jgi:hypothetical protein
MAKVKAAREAKKNHPPRFTSPVFWIYDLNQLIVVVGEYSKYTLFVLPQTKNKQ